MENDKLVQLSAGRTHLGQGAIRQLGVEAAKLGKKALILADETVWEKIAYEVGKALNQAGLKWELLIHAGHCCPSAYERAGEHARRMDADMLVGIGGGRLLDTAKIASDKAKICCITVPTSAATCAAAAWLSVEYTEEGAFVGNYWTEYPPFCTIIDTDIIVRKCPLRLNMAGIVDAMAKYPEIEYNLKFTDNFEKNAFSEVAAETAERIYRFFMEHFEEIQEKLRAGVIDAQVEDALAKAIFVTGLVSSLACGGKQAAVAHLMYSYICCHHPQTADQYLHGEIVGASLCYQLIMDGWESKEVEALCTFLHEAGMPACLGELGINADMAEQGQIFGFLEKGLNVSKNEMARLREPNAVAWLLEGRQKQDKRIHVKSLFS